MVSLFFQANVSIPGRKNTWGSLWVFRSSNLARLFMKTAIVYHQVKPGIDCADGITSAWVAKRKYAEADLIGASYGGALPNLD
jgi:hypothetical protein